MTWETVVVTYFFLGVITTWMADIGHRSKYGYPPTWHFWLAGIIAWPIPFIVTLWRK